MMIAYVRNNRKEEFEHRQFGPMTRKSVNYMQSCLTCGDPMGAGGYTTLVPIGPGSDPKAQKKHREGKWYNAVAVEVHYSCGTGNKPLLREGNKVHSIPNE